MPKPAQKSRAGLIVLLVLGAAVLYAGYFALCMKMEAEGRQRFHVLSRADIAAISDRRAQVRAEASRNLALAGMEAWTPYAAYSIFVGAVVAIGTIGGGFLAARTIWRGVRRESVGSAKTILVGTLLAILALLAVLGAPWWFAQNRIEEQRTAFEQDTLHR
jgi:hypothetical protein